MPPERQAEIIDYVYHITSNIYEVDNIGGGNSKIHEAQTVAALKQWLELHYGRVWHVLCIRGSYWMQYSHEIDCSLQFQLGSFVYLLWRTPSD